MVAKKRYHDLYAELQGFARLYTFRDPNVACLFGLRVNECYVLDYLARHGPLSVTDLAQALGIHKSNVSRILAALETEALTQITDSPSDRRTRLAALTKSGQHKHAEIQAYFVDRLSGALKQFSAAELTTIQAAITALTIDATSRILEVDALNVVESSR